MRRSAHVSVSIVCGFSLLIGTIPAHADQWTRINDSQCAVAHAAIAAGQPLPFPELFAKDATSMDGNVLELYITSKLKDDVLVAVDNWLAVTDGKVDIRVVDQPTERSVTVEDDHTNMPFAGYNIDPPVRKIVLNRGLDMTPASNRQYVIAHEMGHAMGLEHACSGDIMLGGGSGKTPSLVPTATDGAAVVANLR